MKVHKIDGAVFGLALGDAIGAPVEFVSLRKISKRYGRRGYMPIPRPLKFTDDTQMTIALAKAIVDARSLTPRELVRTITNRFIEWSDHDEPRAPGVSCKTSIANLKRARRAKRSWISAPVKSHGCGANMRVLPAALIADLDVAIGVTHLQAALTHATPLAIASSELTMLAMRWAMQGVDLIELPQMLLNRVDAVIEHGSYNALWLGELAQRRWGMHGDVAMHFAWMNLRGVIQKVIKLLQKDYVHDVCAYLGDAWVADEALATGLYFAVKYGSDPLLAISMAARTEGDSDSIACIAGAIVGGHAGIDAWPTDAVKRMERRNELLGIGRYLGENRR